MKLTLLLDPSYIPADSDYYGLPESLDEVEENWQPNCDISVFWHAIAPLIDSLDDSCGALLDVGDVEFIEWSRCPGLAAWAKNQLGRRPGEPLEGFCAKLYEYATRACELKTGVNVEL